MLIRSKFPGKCKVCSGEIHRGDTVGWQKGQKGVTCQKCVNAATKPADPDRDESDDECDDAPTSAAAAWVAGPVPGNAYVGQTIVTTCPSVSNLLWHGRARYFGDEQNRFTLAAREAYANQGGDWFGGVRLDDVHKLIERCPPELLSEIERLRRLLADEIRPVRITRRLVRGLEDGDDLDADRFLANDDLCWTGRRKRVVATQIVRIVIDTTINWKQKAAELLYRGAAVCALCDALAAEGISTEVIAVSRTLDPTRRTTEARIITTIKASDAPVDMSTIAVTTASLSWQRLVVIPAMCKGCIGKLKKSYGYCRLIDGSELVRQHNADVAATYEITSEAAARRWLVDSVRTITGATAMQTA